MAAVICPLYQCVGLVAMGPKVERRDNFWVIGVAGVTPPARANHSGLRDILPHKTVEAVSHQRALMRAARRDNFRDTVFL